MSDISAGPGDVIVVEEQEPEEETTIIDSGNMHDESVHVHVEVPEMDTGEPAWVGRLEEKLDQVLALQIVDVVADQEHHEEVMETHQEHAEEHESMEEEAEEAAEEVETTAGDVIEVEAISPKNEEETSTSAARRHRWGR